ncbi:hypothetical protein RclHR1_03400009 [Rhizophagus clarus]|uniref:BTB domain-containing protein n=1 Tax=Rhizophagus clarus TaxID=94130 RepID=A0A2Z6R9J1_9GLOM|nr:hypothetical protein RclHR1_03400009 [Rhizophagus clarus]GES97529.1 hypothetical protein GLOIN_2v1482344 [Rhizophagus clarus]
MTKGRSLEQDLGLLINNPKYSDIEILCKDGKTLYACRAILGARSDVLDGLLYNGMKESHESEISFPEINSAGMEIILEYIYTGSVKEESLTKDNTIEAFYAADYFQLSDLQDFITKTIKNINFAKKYAPELLSKVSEATLTTRDDILLNVLVETVAIIKLNNVKFGRLSITGLKYLLSITYGKDSPFATNEYDVLRYSVILTAKQISEDTYKAFMEWLPTLKQIENSNNSISVENKFVIDHQKVAKELEPLIEYIDFKRIDTHILANFIEPLKVIPTEIICSAYRNVALLNNLTLNNVRGKPQISEIDLVWDVLACGSKLIIKDNGKVVQAPDGCGVLQSVRITTSTILLENKGIYEWDIIYEGKCNRSRNVYRNFEVGVCALENYNHEIAAGLQLTGWVLGSDGCCRHSGNSIENYCPSFKEVEETEVTVHLDMNRRTCAFTVNGIKYAEVPEWDNLPSRLYPVVSLCYPGLIQIQPR